MKYLNIVVSAIMCLAFSNLQAQSLDRVQTLLEQGEYREAAVMLRPLADGGNAEAQFIAAQLFFEGKGVSANKAQGLKYAKLAADQGHERAMVLLLNNVESSQTYQLLKKYTDQHPYLKRGELGLILAECYIRGTLGAPKNEKLGWDIFEINDVFEKTMRESSDWQRQTQKKYWGFKMRESGKSCLEDYADFLFKIGSSSHYELLVDYIENAVYNSSAQQLKLRAESGNPWAMARLAKVYDDQGYESTAKEWAQKAVNAGSAYGRSVMKKYTYVPVTYSDITAASSPRYTKIEKVIQEWDKTIVQLKYTNVQGFEYVYTDPSTVIVYGGKSYKMISSTLPLSPHEKRITYNQVVYYTMVFEGLPHDARVFDLNQGTWKWSKVRLK